MKLFAVVCLSLSVAVPTQQVAAATLYKCVGADGVKTFQQTPCEQDQEAVGETDFMPDHSAPRPAYVNRARPPAEPEPTQVIEYVEPMAIESAPSSMDDRLSGLVECVAADGKVYVARGRCDTRSRTRATTAINVQNGEPMNVLLHERTRDSGRGLTVGQACQAARDHLAAVMGKIGRDPQDRRDAEKMVGDACGR